MNNAKLKNIEVFSLCVVSIMDALYDCFPIPDSLGQPEFFSAYDPYQPIRNKQPIQVDDPDYERYFHLGFDEVMQDANVIAGLSGDERMHAIKGRPYYYYTNEERLDIRNRITLYGDAVRIFRETANFLTREGYIVTVDLPTGHTGPREYTLTSKGFAHLNREFRNKTIQSNFQDRILGNVDKVLTTGNATAAFTTTLMGAVLKLLSVN